MTCESIQPNLSEYVDGGLEASAAADIRAHLAECDLCAGLCEDLAAILNNSKFEELAEVGPPNSHALWCRISNTIEADAVPPKPPAVPEQPKGFFARVWNLSLGQAASAMAAIALVSSLLTIVGIRNYLEPSTDDFTSRTGESQTTFEKLLGKVGLIDTPKAARERRLKEQQAAIDYWSQRVQAKRVMWDENLRRGFDRNLQAIDQAVIEYKQSLEQDPDDELSGEMLDSVMNEKMSLLREFSEL